MLAAVVTLLAPSFQPGRAAYITAGLVHHRLDGKMVHYIVLGFAIVSGVAVTIQAL